MRSPLGNDDILKRMTTDELISLEKYLWTWMEMQPLREETMAMLNLIHREIELRHSRKDR